MEEIEDTYVSCLEEQVFGIDFVGFCSSDLMDMADSIVIIQIAI